MLNPLGFSVLVSPDLCQLLLRQHWLSSLDHGYWSRKCVSWTASLAARHVSELFR